MKKILSIAALSLFASSAMADDWIGVGSISDLYIYPGYAVVVQGNTGPGPKGNCANDGAWSFNWSDFDEQTQNRIQSMLVAAKISGANIQVAASSTECGPEGKKKFNGQFSFR